MTEYVCFGPLDQDLITAGADDVYGIEISYHAGVPTYPLVAGETPEQTAYREMRERHSFLTDDNHTYRFEPAEKPEWHNRLVVIKNENSPRFLVRPWWVEDGPGAHWFTERWRVVTRGIIAAEAACERTNSARWAAEAEAQRDTVRGRKAAKKLRSMSSGAASVARWIEERWPQHLSKIAA
jgi:hypothetical protein